MLSTSLRRQICFNTADIALNSNSYQEASNNSNDVFKLLNTSSDNSSTQDKENILNLITDNAVNAEETNVIPTVGARGYTAKNLRVKYGNEIALHGVDLKIKAKQVTSLIGPSGCGKSTFLRCLNRMNDYITDCMIEGEVILDGFGSIYAPEVDPVALRSRVGMVFQSPNPFPKSIYENVAYGPRIHGLVQNKQELDALVESSLRSAGLWSEVKSKLKSPGTSLSGGQQQRLCIARAIAVSPEVILMDEPCSALDPIATGVIEELIKELAENYTIVIVTHSMSQAKRISKYTAFFHLGRIEEDGDTKQIFENPQKPLTSDYIMGRSG